MIGRQPPSQTKCKKSHERQTESATKAKSTTDTHMEMHGNAGILRGDAGCWDVACRILHRAGQEERKGSEGLNMFTHVMARMASVSVGTEQWLSATLGHVRCN